MTPAEYKRFKGLSKENLRDYMTDLELIFNMLGEASTAEIERAKDPKSFPERKNASKEGGEIAKNARVELEKKTKKRIISSQNYIDSSEGQKRLEANREKKKKLNF